MQIAATRTRERPAAGRAARLALAVVLFPVAIQVLQAGAAGVAAPLREFLGPRSLAATLGLGWLAAGVALSGSPVAAAALALLERGALDERQCFALVVGTRFGSISVALVLGALYGLVRRGPRATGSLEVGLLAFLTTQLVGWLSLAIGLAILPGHHFEVETPAALLGLMGRVGTPFARAIADSLPGPLVFVLGVGAVLASFRFLEGALPHARGIDRARLARIGRNHGLLFGLGFAMTLVTPSVSVSIGLLVPLHAKGWITAARIVPYVLGANIAAFSDTVLAAFLLGHAPATNVVLTEVASIAIAALAALAAHDTVEALLVRLTRAIVRRRAVLGGFLFLAGAIPVALAVLS